MTKISTRTKIKCYHCGDNCGTGSVSIGDKYFCCPGCRAVYNLLGESDMSCYYQIDSSPGTPVENPLINNEFAYLDDQQLQKSLLDFSDENISKITLLIPQMHCSACIWLLENLYKLKQGIISSRVNFMRKELSVTFNDKKISLRTLVEMLVKIGYRPQISLAKQNTVDEDDSLKKLYIKVGVAGFCFANIMLLSLPEYLAIGELEAVFGNFFGYLSIILALPVFFYSASGYLSSAIAAFRQKSINIDVPISLGIIILFARSLYEIISGAGSGYLDSMSGLVFFLLIGRVFQKKTYDSLSFERDYHSYFPIAVSRLADGSEERIPLANIQIGDRILVRHQELIPADSVLINGQGEIDYSFVTGESQPIRKTSGDYLYAGGRQAGGLIELEIVKEVSQSKLIELWNNEIFKKKVKGKFVSLANRISKHFTISILSIAIATFTYWSFTDITTAFLAATAVLIIACPCALALSTPFTLGTVMRVFARNRFFMRDASSIEDLAGIKSVIFDKTGTLTKTGEYQISFSNEKLSKQDKLLAASLASQSSHPLSRQIMEFLDVGEYLQVEDFHEEAGQGISGNIDNRKIKLGSANWVGCEVGSVDNQIATLVYLSINNTQIGHYKISAGYRHGLKEVVEKLNKNYKLQILSGDNDSEKQRLKEIFGENTLTHFNQSPQDKLAHVAELQQEEQKVLMIGDGLNDAGALKQADVGIALSEDLATFSPACDGILDAKNFSKLSDFIKLTKKSLSIIIISFVISFLYNVIGLGFAVAGKLSPLLSAILMPASSITVVIFAVVATELAARRLRL